MIEPRDLDLLEGYLDGTLTDAEAAEFRSRVAESKPLAKALIRATTDLARVRAWAVNPPVPVATEPSEVATPRVRRLRRPLTLVGLCFGLLAVFVGVRVLWNDPPAVELPARFEIVGSDSAREWERPPSDPSHVAANEPVRLASGSIKLVTPANVEIVAAGPCAFRCLSAQEIQIDSGKIYCEVPVSGHGFAVQTRGGRIVDLGTRFGVEVNPDGDTEVHVYEGVVVAETPGAKAHVRTREAVSFAPMHPTVRPVPMRDKFVRHPAATLETFDYPKGRLSNRGGWIASTTEFPAPVIGINAANNIRRPSLVGGQYLELNALGKKTAPVGHQWRDGFTSAVIHLDDDFSKELARERIARARLIALSRDELDSARAISLVVRSADDRGQLVQFGVEHNNQLFWSQRTFAHGERFFVALDTRATLTRLWVNPSPESVGRDKPPPADLEVKHPPRDPSRKIWLSDLQNPSLCWWFVDEIRGGTHWPDVMPFLAVERETDFKR